MVGPWPIALITWYRESANAVTPTLNQEHALFSGPGGAKGPDYFAVVRVNPEDDAQSMEQRLEYSHAGWTASFLGIYLPLNEQAEPPLESARAGLMVGLTDCRSQEDQLAFNTWYREVHAADVLRAGFHERAYRYRQLQPSTTPQAPEYCALYETRDTGFAAFKALMYHYREHPSAVEPFCLVRNVWALDG